jgi:hypothetical protein
MDVIATRIENFGELTEGEMSYWKATDGNWYLYLPGCGIGNLGGHDVIEHQDGTITAHPSILVTGHESGTPTQKHGYLTCGVWRDC